MKIKLVLVVVVILAVAPAFSGTRQDNRFKSRGDMKTIRTYMNFTKGVDQAHIVTMSDLELSIALATPLVTFNEEREPVSALAERWDYIPPNKIVFVLKTNLRWSDGSAITARQYKESLDRAAKAYPDDLRALFDSITQIDANDDRLLTFTTKGDVLKSGILLKLTEPMYGLAKIKNGQIDPSVTSGAYFLKRTTDDELILSANEHWYQFKKEMPMAVEIKRPPPGVDLIEAFPKDDWANLISGTSLMKSSTEGMLVKAGFKTWHRTLDKTFSIFSSKAFIDRGGTEFIKLLAKKINTDDLMSQLAGHAKAEQFFPRGYDLWSSTKVSIYEPKPTKIKSIKVIIPDNPYALSFKERLTRTIEAATGAKVECELFPLPQLNDRMKKGNFDIMAAGFAVADPNFEGAMSFFVERDPAPIQSSLAPNDFANQTKLARSLPSSQERAQKMREIILHAQEAGFFLPLFHFSSLAVAKHGVNISSIPNSDETVLFSKVRME